MRRLFVFGTLMDADVLAAVLGRAPSDIGRTPARLAGHAVERARGAAFPLLVARASAAAEGLLLTGLTEADMARLDAYESELYRRAPCTVETADGPAAAEVYLAGARLASSGEPWSLAEWQARRKAARPGRT